MPWILLMLAVACFLVPFLTTSVGLGVLCVLLALLFFVAGVMTLISSRMEYHSRSGAQILTPDELRGMRERAEAQRQTAAPLSDDRSPPSAAPPA